MKNEKHSQGSMHLRNRTGSGRSLLQAKPFNTHSHADHGGVVTPEDKSDPSSAQEGMQKLPDKEKIKSSLVTGKKTSHVLPQKHHWAQGSEPQHQEPSSALLSTKNRLKVLHKQHTYVSKSKSKDNSASGNTKNSGNDPK